MEHAIERAVRDGMERAPGLGGMGRERVEAVMEALARLQGRSETLAEVAHDARNMVTALVLYCDLLEEPGVLAAPFAHYGSELRLVAAASRRLVEKLVGLDICAEPGSAGPQGTIRRPSPDSRFGQRAGRTARADLHPARQVVNLAAELLANRNLLAAMAGPLITLTLDAVGGALPVRLTGEDLTRVMVNLVKNAAEAMPGSGSIQIYLREQPSAAGRATSLLLTVEDTGAGIPAASMETIFEAGYTSRARENADNNSWAGLHRGLGLSIARSLIEAAGGRIRADDRPGQGAMFSIELPVSSR